jgi:hypothetical protein
MATNSIIKTQYGGEHNVKLPSKIAAITALGLLGASAHAAEVSFDFIEIDGATGSFEPTGGRAKEDFTNITLHANKILDEDEKWFADLEIRYTDTDTDAESFGYADIAIGKRIRINKDERNPSSMSLQVGYVTLKDDPGSDEGLSLAIDYRVNTDVNIEFGAGLQVINFSELEQFGVNVRVLGHITDLLGVYVRLEQVDREFDDGRTSIKENSAGIGVRFEF